MLLEYFTPSKTARQCIHRVLHLLVSHGCSTVIADIDETELNSSQKEDESWDCCLKRTSMYPKHHFAMSKVSVRIGLLQAVIFENDIWGCFLQPP